MFKRAQIVLVFLVIFFIASCGGNSGGSGDTDIPNYDPPEQSPQYECELTEWFGPDYEPDTPDFLLQSWQCLNDDIAHIQINHTYMAPSYSKAYNCINGSGNYVDKFIVFEWLDAAFSGSYYTAMAIKYNSESCFWFNCAATGAQNLRYCENSIPGN